MIILKNLDERQPEEIPSTLDALDFYLIHESYTIARDDFYNCIEITKKDDRRNRINVSVDAIVSVTIDKGMLSTIRTKHGYVHLFIDSVMVGMS
jgi:hypothetical protein